MGKKGGGGNGNKAAWQVSAVMEGKTPPSYYIICRYYNLHHYLPKPVLLIKSLKLFR